MFKSRRDHVQIVANFITRIAQPLVDENKNIALKVKSATIFLLTCRCGANFTQNEKWFPFGGRCFNQRYEYRFE